MTILEELKSNSGISITGFTLDETFDAIAKYLNILNPPPAPRKDPETLEEVIGRIKELEQGQSRIDHQSYSHPSPPQVVYSRDGDWWFQEDTRR